MHKRLIPGGARTLDTPCTQWSQLADIAEERAYCASKVHLMIILESNGEKYSVLFDFHFVMRLTSFALVWETYISD